MVKVAAIVLAAGTSSRFSQGSTKLVENFEGKPLVRRSVDAATASLAFPVVVVTGHGREEIRNALHGAEVVFVHNHDYRRNPWRPNKARRELRGCIEPRAPRGACRF
jgi:molybdenum cofactor cytidylyltransferase